MADQTQAVVSLALASRSYANKTVVRELSRGLNRHTEHYAYSHVIPLAQDPSHETRLLRIAGLIASSPISQGNQSFGDWLRRSGYGNAEKRLIRLIGLGFEQAVEEIFRITRAVGDKGASFNWYQLSDTLFFWGKGVSDESLKVRQSILRDYYRTDPVPVEQQKEENGTSDD